MLAAGGERTTRPSGIAVGFLSETALPPSVSMTAGFRTNLLMASRLELLYSSGMGYNPVAPRDRATAQILIVMSTLAILGGIACLLFLDLEKTTRWGFPAWVLLSALIVSGAMGAIRGVRMWRKDRESPQRDDKSAGASDD